MGNICFSLFDEENNNIDVIEEYKHKYISKLEHMKLNPLYRKLDDYYIIEYTPLGNVIMSYDSQNNSFKYYSDKIIPNNFLEVVSRKYVITNFTKILYHKPDNVDPSEEKEGERKDESKKDDTEINSKNTTLPSVYGNVKQLPKIKDNDISSINKYNYKGKINEFKILKKNNIEKKKISYNDYLNKKN